MSMKRRQFLATTAAAAPFALGAVPLGLPRSPLFDALLSDASDRVLVLINLVGGNDGLNSVVPLDYYDELAAVRANILLPQNRLVGLDDVTALHPALAPLRQTWDEARLTIVQSVGYPDQNRSHFRSSDIWSSGSEADEYLRTGWLGRHLDRLNPEYPTGYPNATAPHPAAISLGNLASETCQGLQGTFAQVVNNPLTMASLLESAGGPAPANAFGGELTYVRTTIAQANAYGAVIQDAARAGRNAAPYPGANNAARQLSYVAQMISGGLRAKVYVVSIGGFDTHAAQTEEGTSHEGKHAGLLGQLADAVTAFLADLRALGLGDRVLGMTYSEFGRRIRSNAAFGTDHGSAAPLLLFGDCVNAGILGSSPVVDRAVDDQEGVAMQYDFRDVYGSVLEDWFGLDATTVRGLLYDGYHKLPILRNCSATSATPEASPIDAIALQAAPNPFRDYVRLTFKTQRAGRVELVAYDMRGGVVELLFDRRLPAGEQTVTVDTSGYPTGVINFRLRENGRVRVVRAVRG